MRSLRGSIWRSASFVMLYGRLATTFTRSWPGLPDTKEVTAVNQLRLRDFCT